MGGTSNRIIKGGFGTATEKAAAASGQAVAEGRKPGAVGLSDARMSPVMFHPRKWGVK